MTVHVTFFLLVVIENLIEGCHSLPEKRELPLSVNCNPIYGTCYKGDLISEYVADCKRDSWFSTCTPINDYWASSVVDVSDGYVKCNPVTNKRILCGTENTRCVCFKPVDWDYPVASLFPQCRCQYWPKTDERMNNPSYCTQYDHGGTSGKHFYGCCNNCNDDDTSCTGDTYQGGGTNGDYCGECGLASLSGGGRLTYRFNCLSCVQQRACSDKCDIQWFGATKAIPGLCPKWIGCFRECCVQAQNRYGFRKKRDDNQTVSVDFDFCGDFECQNPAENTTNCPIDCCPEVNPTCNNFCTNDTCCYAPGCCIEDSYSPTNSSSPTDSLSASNVLIASQVMMLTEFLFILISFWYN